MSKCTHVLIGGDGEEECGNLAVYDKDAFLTPVGPQNLNVWCPSCITYEWPNSSIEELLIAYKIDRIFSNKFILLWKGVDINFDYYFGALRCPYRLKELVVINGHSNWLLSPIGAIKENYGTCLMAAIAEKSKVVLRQDLVVNYFGDSVLPVFACKKYKNSKFRHPVDKHAMYAKQLLSATDNESLATLTELEFQFADLAKAEISDMIEEDKDGFQKLLLNMQTLEIKRGW